MIPTLEQWIKSEPIFYAQLNFKTMRLSHIDTKISWLKAAVDAYVNDYCEYESDRIDKKFGL